MPFGKAVGGGTFPDILYCLMVAWVIRRSATAPLLLVLLLAIIGDVMMMRPLGLWALLLVLATELMRYSEKTLYEVPFVIEWIYVSLLFLLLQLAQNLIFFVTFSETYPLADILWYFLATSLVYPVIVLFLNWVVRVRFVEEEVRSSRLGRIS